MRSKGLITNNWFKVKMTVKKHSCCPIKLLMISLLEVWVKAIENRYDIIHRPSGSWLFWLGLLNHKRRSWKIHGFFSQYSLIASISLFAWIYIRLKVKTEPMHCTEVRFASFLFSRFTTMAVMTPPEKKLEKSTSVQCALH